MESLRDSTNGSPPNEACWRVKMKAAVYKRDVLPRAQGACSERQACEPYLTGRLVSGKSTVSVGC